MTAVTLLEFMKRLRANFYDRLEQKTGWGKEQLKLEFEHAISDALASLTDEQS